MPNSSTMNTGNSPWTFGGRRVRGALILVMGCVAMMAPVFAGTLAVSLVGVLLIVCGVLEMLETFYADREAERRSVYLSGALSVLAGGCLLARPLESVTMRPARAAVMPVVIGVLTAAALLVPRAIDVKPAIQLTALSVPAQKE